ncbi:hypothetical protein J3R82DRAFT_11215 [Butyriboletus roseoflavus]|nr:hypothetical protein J3R82DRAFT_11215 [Butyriboletus roseoflavus]
MSRLPGNFYPSSACSTAHAISCVFTLPLPPPARALTHLSPDTGDRPYKCQYCGDQFARSDLLARHINKCHANEKPLPSATPGTRRKGSAATSRATTSKQACDHPRFVPLSLLLILAHSFSFLSPCPDVLYRPDLAAKCVSRKCRCTYVKFHRQTAPSGPGHHPPRSPSSSSSSLSGSSRLPSHLDDFVLAPPPSAPSIPPSDQMFHTPFTFSPATPAYPTTWTTPDMSQMPFSIPSDADMAAKYRTQAEILRRAGPSILSNSSPTMLPSVYPIQQHQPPSNNWYPAWGESGTYPPLDDTKSFEGIARTHSLASSETPSFPPEFYGPGLIGSAYRPRRISLDFSDSSSATSQSVPSSAASSSVHLPLPGNEMYEAHSEEMQRQTHDTHIRRSSIPTSQPPSFPGPSEPSHPHPQHHVGEGGFSSAFGLMSIDDPNVLAGLSSDGVPFFSNIGMGVLPHSPNLTPMPARVQHTHPHQGRDRGMSLSALPTPRLSKDVADTRELKDVWKTYMRSPLSGPGTAVLDQSTSQPLSLSQMPQSPSGQRRRVRVSSLPSVTPTAERGHPLMVNGHGHGDVGAAMRTTVHGNPEDLRSYEAAVNARNASLKLNLVPRQRRTQPGVNGSSPMEGTGAPSFTATGVGAGQADHQRISRPSSSSSSSSLAQAFTVPTLQQHPHQHHHHLSHAHAPVSGVVKPPPMQGASISLPIPPSMSMSGLHSSPHSHGHGHSITFGSSTSLTFEPGSRASSVTSDGTGTGGSGSDGEVFRPSFKRYPSQTLGPVSSKRAMVERGGGSKGVKMDFGERDRDDDGDGMEGMEGFECVGVSAGVGSRPIAGLPERARRA